MEKRIPRKFKRLLCVTGTEQMSRHLLSHTRSVFGDRLGVACFPKCGRALSFQGVLCAKPGIIIGLSEESVEYARARSEGIPIINARFCLHEPRNIDKLFLLPPGKEVLVINKTKLHTEETIRRWRIWASATSGMSPYYEGCAEDVSGLDTAISPSVFNYGPQHITNRIDIGFRGITIETCAAIAEALDMPKDYLNNYINIQRNVLTQTFKHLSEEYLQAQHLKKHAAVHDRQSG